MISTASTFRLASAFSTVHQGRGHIEPGQRLLSVFGRQALSSGRDVFCLLLCVSSALDLKGD